MLLDDLCFLLAKTLNRTIVLLCIYIILASSAQSTQHCTSKQLTTNISLLNTIPLKTKLIIIKIPIAYYLTCWYMCDVFFEPRLGSKLPYTLVFYILYILIIILSVLELHKAWKQVTTYTSIIYFVGSDPNTLYCTLV